MIPILYSANETTFTHNGIGRLIDCTSCRVTEERNGAFECEFDYPIEGQYYSEISLDRIVKAKANEMSDDQLFRIYRISKPISGIVSVYCQHISYDLSVNVVLPFSLINDSAQNAMNAIFNNLSKPNQHTYTYTATVGGTHDFKVETPVPVRQALGGDEGSLLDVFGGEFEFDNFNIRLHQNRGQDRGVTILYGKNLTDAKSETNMTTAYTAILPYAVNDEDDTPVHLLDGNNKTIAIDGAPTYGEPRVLAVDLTSMYDLQEEDITSANLRQRANTYLSENDLETISQNIEISFVQLWQTEEYKNIAVLERVALCDTVTVRYEKLGIDATAKVVKTVYDTINEKYESIEIGDAKSNFLESLRKEAKEQGKKAIKENYSAMQAAIDNATKLITGQSGGYIIFRNSTTIFDSNGNVVETKTLPKGQPAEMLIMDKPDVNTASKVWRYNLSGWGYSSTGVNGPFRLAATSNGAIVADFITTGTLTANIITAGQLQDQAGKNYWNLNNGNFRLSQTNAFNSLTHDGDTQGIYMVPVQGEDYNELRINASYIKSGTIDAGVVNVTNINASNINTGTIDASVVAVTNLNANNIKTGTIDAGVVNVTNLNANNITLGTIDASIITVTNLNANNIKAGIIRDQTNATAKNYWNLSTGEFRLTAGTKVYKDDGTDSGIFYKASGELRINADFIKSGTIDADLIKAGEIKSRNERPQVDYCDCIVDLDNGRFRASGKKGINNRFFSERTILNASGLFFPEFTDPLAGLITVYEVGATTTPILSCRVDFLKTNKLNISGRDLQMVQVQDINGNTVNVLGYY